MQGIFYLTLIIFNLVVYFQELKLCTSALPVIEPVIVPVKAQMVGVNECTYGPSYWCASYENAKQCKVSKYGKLRKLCYFEYVK